VPGSRLRSVGRAATCVQEKKDGRAKDSQFIPHVYAVNQEASGGRPECQSEGAEAAIMDLLDLPLEMDDPYWDEWESSYLRTNRTRRQLFEDRFNLAMYRIRKKRGIIYQSNILGLTPFWF
jgi:hypothetical protein